MTLAIRLDLSEDDLKHFQLIMQHARSSAAHISPEDVVAGAEHLIEQVKASGAPQYVLDNLSTLELMIAMISDIDWRLPEEDADRVFNALSYFAEPEDLIPDNIPGIGFLDDAIMIEVVARELRREIDTYRDFCAYRDELRKESPNERANREDWLATRRKELKAGSRKLSKSANPLSTKNLFSRD